jgi:hypothetical protein
MRPEFVPLLALYALTALAPVLAIVVCWLSFRRRSAYGFAMLLGGLSGAVLVVLCIWLVGKATADPLDGAAATWFAFACAGFSLFALLGASALAIRRCLPPASRPGP